MPFARPRVAVNERPVTAHLNCGQHQRQRHDSDQANYNQCATCSHVKTERSGSPIPCQRHPIANRSAFAEFGASAGLAIKVSMSPIISSQLSRTRSDARRCHCDRDSKPRITWIARKINPPHPCHQRNLWSKKLSPSCRTTQITDGGPPGAFGL
jgi:hypothetical protein